MQWRIRNPGSVDPDLSPLWKLFADCLDMHRSEGRVTESSLFPEVQVFIALVKNPGPEDQIFDTKQNMAPLKEKGHVDV